MIDINLTELAIRIDNDLQLNNTKKSKELAEYFIKLLVEYGDLENTEIYLSMLDEAQAEIKIVKEAIEDDLDIETKTRKNLCYSLNDLYKRIREII